MYETAVDIQHDDKRFAAALKGVNLDEGKVSDFDEVKRRAEARAHGMSEEQYELDGLFDIIDEDGE